MVSMATVSQLSSLICEGVRGGEEEESEGEGASSNFFRAR